MTWDLSTVVSFLSVFLAWLSVWIAHKDLKTNNDTMLALQSFKCSYGQKMGFANNQWFSVLTIRIRNKGVPLYNPVFRLQFDEGLSRRSVPMSHLLPGVKDTKMERGMIAEISMRSFDEEAQRLFSEITDAQKQRAAILVISQGYECAEIPLFVRFQRLRNAWNEIGIFLQVTIPRYWNYVRDKLGKQPRKELSRIVPPGERVWGFPYATNHPKEISNFREYLGCLQNDSQPVSARSESSQPPRETREEA
jgi:hypothetical protein